MKKVAFSALCCLILSLAITSGCRTSATGTLLTTMVATITISPVPATTVTATPLPVTTFPALVTNLSTKTITLAPVTSTVVGPPLTTTSTYTMLNPAQTVTVTEYPPPMTILATQTSSTLGPDIFLVDTIYSTRNIYIDAGKIFHFAFATSGSGVRYWVLDAAGSPVFIGSTGVFVPSGGGDFLAVAGGTYQMIFGVNILASPAVVILYYWTT